MIFIELNWRINRRSQRQTSMFKINDRLSMCFRLQSLASEYKKLEEEFRDALKIEERRYQEVNRLPLSPLFLTPLSVLVDQDSRYSSEREWTSSIDIDEHQTTRGIRSKDGQWSDAGQSTETSLSLSSSIVILLLLLVGSRTETTFTRTRQNQRESRSTEQTIESEIRTNNRRIEED